MVGSRNDTSHTNPPKTQRVLYITSQLFKDPNSLVEARKKWSIETPISEHVGRGHN